MIPNLPVAAEITKDGVEDSMDFSLDMASMAHILNMLRSGVYKDPKMACLREYWCNARDAVVEAGGDLNKDVIITLPNHHEPYLKIQDFGVGLSETDFRRIFRKYGASTKRDSNEQIGQLGIGSKSAFSYSDTYTITAIKNCIKRVFIATVARDSVAADGVGSLNKVMETDTDERNGIEISIPIKDKDFGDFVQKARFFFSFVNPSERPTFKGVPGFEVPTRSAHNFKGIDKPEGWRIQGEGRSYAIMGGVPYNLDTKAMDNFTTSEKALIDIGIDMEFPIGSLDPAISREELRYTEFTQKSIKQKMKSILTLIAKTFEEKVKGCRNIWEAKYMYGQLQTGMEGRVLKNCFSGNRTVSIKWKDFEIDNDDIVIPEKYEDDIYIHSLHRMSDGRVGRNRQEEISVRTSEQPIIVMHDAKRYGEWQRVSTILNKVTPLKGATQAYATIIYLIRFASEMARDEFYKANPGFETLVTSNLSQYERDPKLAKKKLQTAKAFVFNSNSCAWKDEDDYDMDEGGVYTQIDKFYAYVGGMQMGPTAIRDFLVTLGKIRAVPETLWGFKVSMADKARQNSKWESLQAYGRRVIEAYLTKHTFTQSEVDKAYWEKLGGVLENHPEYPDHKYVNTTYTYDTYRQHVYPLLRADSPLKEYIEEHRKIEIKLKSKDELVEDLIRYYTRLGGDADALRKMVVAQPTKGITDFVDRAKIIALRYPFLTILDTSSLYRGFKLIADYVNDIDSSTSLPKVTP